MRFPSKVTPYKQSIISKFPVILSKLRDKDMTPEELYRSVKNKVDDVTEFMDIMDCLYALQKIDFEDGVLHYAD